jgi:hypothetical protein
VDGTLRWTVMSLNLLAVVAFLACHFLRNRAVEEVPPG